MKALVLNLLLAMIWAGLTGKITASSLVIGFVFGYVLLWWMRGLLGYPTYFKKVPQVVSFVLFFLKELLISNLRVARDVVSLKRNSRPGIVAVPLDLKTDLEITLLAGLIALTPGTMALDVSSDRKVLYVHAMFITNPDVMRNSIKEGLERRVMELFK